MFRYRRWKMKPSSEVQSRGRIDGSHRGIKPGSSSIRAFRWQIQVTGFCSGDITSIHEKLEVIGLQLDWRKDLSISAHETATYFNSLFDSERH